mgnify:CR=1 FL=1
MGSLITLSTSPRDLRRWAVIPIVSAASPAHRAAAEAYSTARLARRACKDDACIAKGSAAVTFAEVTLTRALGKGPLSLPDAALRGYLEAERARATRAEDGSTPPPSRDLLRVRAAAPDGSPLHFAAAYILAHAEDDPGERRRLLEALVKSPPPKGYVRSELLFWIGQLSSTPAEAVRFFRQAHEAAHQERERGDASEGVVEIATAYAWLRAATGHLPPEVPPAVHAIVVYIAHKPPASSEGVEDFETEIAPAIAWAIDRGASFRGVRVTSRAWEQAALALATRTRARGDEVVASRAESLAHAPETELRPIPTWGLGETRVRALELERACAAASESPSPIKPHSLVVKDGVVSVTRPEEHEGSEMACIRERGARYLWNAPNIEIDVVPEK